MYLYAHMRYLVLSCFLLLSLVSVLPAQGVEEALSKVEKEKAELLAKVSELDAEIEGLKLQKIITDLNAIGLPSDDYIEHSAMILEYSEEHEQAKWVAHMILPEIADGQVFRSNDFRSDPLVKTGTAVQSDYFLTDTMSNGKVEYDGYGYDRGHLAASADFRWSKQALSESYFYSNMSPQLPEFNRESWAALENHLRQYVIVNRTPLYILTAPVLSADLEKITRATNNVTVPKHYVKAVYDPAKKVAIGFIMPSQQNAYPLEHYAVAIDEVEELIGLNIFQSLDEKIESKLDKVHWFEELKSGDVEPIYQPSLPPAHFNTIVAKTKVGKNVKVCGKVVATKYSKKGHLWMNLDKHFPNQVFSVFVRKESLVNFDVNLKDYFTNELICVNGKVDKFSDTPSIEIRDDHAISFFKPKPPRKKSEE